MVILPNFQGEHKQYLSCHHLDYNLLMPFDGIDQER